MIEMINEMSESVKFQIGQIRKYMANPKVAEKKPTEIQPLVRFQPVSKDEDEAKKTNIYTKDGYKNVLDNTIKEQRARSWIRSTR